MQNIHWIILAIVAVNVIGAIVKGLSKSQQKERQGELAAERRRAAMQQGQQGQQSAGPTRRPGSQGAGGQQGGRYPTGRPLDALAQRRKEQLEQLRQRRQQRGTTPPTQARASTQPSPSASQPAGLSGPRLTSLADKMEKTRRAEQRLQERREAAARAKVQQAQAQRQAQRTPAQPARQAGRARVTVPQLIEPDDRTGHRKHDKDLQRLHSSLSAEPQSMDEAYAIDEGGASEFSKSVQRQMRNPASLRQLFVLKELLDSPISLRPGGFGE